MIIFRRLSSVTVDLPKILEIDTPCQAREDQSKEYSYISVDEAQV